MKETEESGFYDFSDFAKNLEITWTFYFDLPLLLNSKNVNSPKESKAFHRFPF